MTAIRSWALLDTLPSSGLRASGVAALRVGDCLLGYGQASLAVPQGKGGKQRGSFIPQELGARLKAFLAWKKGQGEDVSNDARFSRASSADLEIVQEQLGHASIKTTTIYAKVTNEDKARAADALAKAFRYSQENRASGASWPRRRPGSSGVPPGSVASP